VGLLALAAASIVLSELDLHPTRVWEFSTPARFQFFVPGMLLALALVRMEGRRPAWLDHPLVSADTFLLLAVPVWLVVFLDAENDLLPLGALGCLLIVAAAVLPLRRRALSRVLNWRPLAAVGIASYSLYLWHAPVVIWVGGPSSHSRLAYLTYSAFALALCLVVAFVSYRLIEAPPLRLRRRWFAGSGAPRSSLAHEEDPSHGRSQSVAMVHDPPDLGELAAD
jgi:peptidoglycan/LPS O-acetylase OafA/YrhL